MSSKVELVKFLSEEGRGRGFPRGCDDSGGGGGDCRSGGGVCRMGGGGSGGGIGGVNGGGGGHARIRE